MGKVDNMQEQMSNINRKMKILTKIKKKECCRSKTLTKIKNAFDFLINKRTWLIKKKNLQ